MARLVKKRKVLPRVKRIAANKLFLPDYLTEVKMVAMRGLDDKEISQIFGINYDLFKKWKKTYPSFRDALETGRTRADAEVVAALFKRATGKFKLKETKVIKYKDFYETLDVNVHYPPDTEAAKYWLNNRKREHWQQRSAVEQSGPGGKPIEITANKSELIDAIVSLVQPKPDGDDSSSKKKASKSSQPK